MQGNTIFKYFFFKFSFQNHWFYRNQPLILCNKCIVKKKFKNAKLKINICKIKKINKCLLKCYLYTVQERKSVNLQS